MIYTNTHKRLLTKTIYLTRLIIWRWNQDVGRSDLGRYNLGVLKPDTSMRIRCEIIVIQLRFCAIHQLETSASKYRIVNDNI